MGKPTIPGYIPPAIVAVEVLHHPSVDNNALPVYRWYDWPTVTPPNATIDVRSNSTVRVWIAFLHNATVPATNTSNATDLAALTFMGFEVAGLDLTAYPEGHPSRPRPCNDTASGGDGVSGTDSDSGQGRPWPGRRPVSPSGNDADLSCWSFIMPDGEGDGTQPELRQFLDTARIARSLHTICIIAAPDERVECWAAENPDRLVQEGGMDGFGQPNHNSTWAVVRKLPPDLPPARQIVISTDDGSRVVGDLACALLHDGRAVCWGDFAQAPNGDWYVHEADVNTPFVPLHAINNGRGESLRFTYLNGHAGAICGLTAAAFGISAGEVWWWGERASLSTFYGPFKDWIKEPLVTNVAHFAMSMSANFVVITREGGIRVLVLQQDLNAKVLVAGPRGPGRLL